MEHRATLNNQSGFTLIEFCVAVLILMVGLLGLLQAVNVATVFNRETFLRNEAISLADESMVMIKTAVYDAPTMANIADTVATATNPDGTLRYPVLVRKNTRGGFCNYSVVRTLPAAGATSGQATVRITWRYKGMKKIHTSASFLSQ